MDLGYKYMKLLNISAKALLIFTLVSGVWPLCAAQPPDVPPRGKAYGYFLRDGAYVLFSYSQDDGTRLITLSRCRPGSEYLIESSQDVLRWSSLVVLRAEPGGSVSYLHTAVMPRCFYRVSRAR